MALLMLNALSMSGRKTSLSNSERDTLQLVDDALLRPGQADPTTGGHGAAREVHGGLGDRA
jgi:hypothetical protein